MRAPSISLGVHLTVLVALMACSPGESDQTHRSEYRSDRPVVLDLPSDPFERGRIHGEALKEEIHRQVGSWESDLVAGFGVEPEAFVQGFLAATDYLPSIRQWTPNLLEEVRGIAEGSGLPYETMLVFNFLDEVWLNGGGVSDGDHCSAVGAPASDPRPAFVAQNMDIESFRDGAQTILRIAGEQGEPGQLIFTTAGMIALNGMNDARVGVVVNALAQLRYQQEGLPVAFVVRGLLARTEETELRAFLTDVTHASGQNYMVGVGSTVFDYEASAGKAVEYSPGNPGGVITHTNHPMVNGDLSPSGLVEKTVMAPDELEAGNSRTRMRALLNRLEQAQTVDLGWIQGTLSSRDSPDHPVCRQLRAGGNFTFGSTIMLLGEEPTFLVAPGPPDSWEYQRYEFR
jgi:hypothetical protein